MYTSTSLWCATWTHQSGRIILKKLDPMECFEPAVVTVTHYHQSLPPPHTPITHTHTSWSLYKHPHMTRESTRTHTLLDTQTQRHTWAKEHGQQGHPRAMLHKGQRYNRFTVTLMTAGIQSGWKWRPALVLSSLFFTWWQGGQTETGQHAIRGRPWRWVGLLQEWRMASRLYTENTWWWQRATWEIALWIIGFWSD